MTNNLDRRVYQHKKHEFQGFTYDYDAVRLVYWESFDDVHRAITREKQVKNWRREKKEWLIQRVNPEWKDLSADWYRKAEPQGPSTPLRSARDDRAVVGEICVADQQIAGHGDHATTPETQGPSTSLRSARDDRSEMDPTVIADSEVATLRKKAS